MGAFHQLGEAELAGLSDEELIEYVLAARQASEESAAELALQIFAFGMQARVRAFVATKLDGRGDVVIEEVAERALADAIRSIHTLRGGSTGEACGFVFKVARRRIADHLRSNRIRPGSLDRGWDDEEKRSSTDIEGPGGDVEAAEAMLVVSQCLDDLREDHREVVELTVFEGHSAREAAEEVNSRFDGQFDDSMSEQNAHQIASRFRKVLRERLEGTGKAA